MKSIHDSIMITMLLNKKERKKDDEIEQEGHEHAHTQIERKWQTYDWTMMNMPSVTHFHIRLEQRFKCCYKWTVFSPSPKFLCFPFLREHKRLTEHEAKEHHLKLAFLLCSVPHVRIRSNKKANIWGRRSSKQAGSEWRCPCVRLGQPIYTLPFLLPCVSTFTFLSTHLSSALPSPLLVSGRV